MKKQVALVIFVVLVVTVIFVLPATAEQVIGVPTFEVGSPDSAVYGARPVVVTVTVQADTNATEPQEYDFKIWVGGNAWSGIINHKNVGPGASLYRKECNTPDAVDGCAFWVKGNVDPQASLKAIDISTSTSTHLGTWEFITFTPITPTGSTITKTLTLTVGEGEPEGVFYFDVKDSSSWDPGRCQIVQLLLTSPTLVQFHGEVTFPDVPDMNNISFIGDPELTWEEPAWYICLPADAPIGMHTIEATLWVTGHPETIFYAEKIFWVGERMYIPYLSTG